MYTISFSLYLYTYTHLVTRYNVSCIISAYNLSSLSFFISDFTRYYPPSTETCSNIAKMLQYCRLRCNIVGTRNYNQPRQNLDKSNNFFKQNNVFNEKLNITKKSFYMAREGSL